MQSVVNSLACTPENIAILLEANSNLLEANSTLLETNSTLLDANTKLSAENLQLKARLVELEKKYNWLCEQIKLNKQNQFGQKTETSEHLGIPVELDLAFDEDGTEVKVAEVQEPQEEEPAAELETITYTRKKKTIGRKIDTSTLPREIVIHDLPESDKKCKCCGKPLEQFGEDRSEQLEYIPAQLKVIEHVCLKYTCRCCETIESGKKPELPLAKSMAAPSLISEVITKKFEYHLPWYRQAKIFALDGLEIPANTIGNWFLEAGEILEPLRSVLRAQITETNNLQADETPVKVLKNNHRGYLWGYHSLSTNNRFILFEYNDSRSGKVASETLLNYKGILQTDGYGGYNQLRNKTDVISIGCWAHCRRHFADVVKLSKTAGKAHEVVKWIGKLYQIETKAREANLTYEDRLRLRQAEAPPILEKIHELLTKSNPAPKSSLGKAVTYALNNWNYLTRYVDYGEAEIDNNLMENQIRPFALGRKNWLFLGNERAAQTAAFFYSLIQTCRLNQLDPRKYLSYVLYQAGRMRRQEVEPRSLLPQFIDKALLL